MLFKISRFSEMSGLSVKALRFLDEGDILRPALVDETNGYRYYKPFQIPVAMRIAAYRTAGFSPRKIREFLNLESSGEAGRVAVELDAWLAATRAQIETISGIAEELRNSSNAPALGAASAMPSTMTSTASSLCSNQ